MKTFKRFISEASFLKPDYVTGHKLIFNGSGFKEFIDLGYKKGDVFEIVAPNANVHSVFGKKDADKEKFLKGPDGKIFHIKGSASFKSSSFTHMKESGSPPSGAEWEDLIVYAYNTTNNVKTDPETEEVALKFWDKYSDQAIEIAKNFKKGLKSDKLVQTGRGIGNVSLGPIWKAAGAKNKTPKTDIASADFKEKISLKKAGGSQLASAEKKEAIAIVKAALSEMGSDRNFASNLVQNIENKMSVLLSKESVSTLNQKSKAGEVTDEIVDFQAKDKTNKELSDMLASFINQDTEINALFSKHIVLEASTGNHKFGTPNSKAAANLLGKFEPTGEVVLEPISSINDPIIVKYAASVKPYVAFKKGSGASPAYSAMRLGIKESETFRGIILSEISQVEGLILTEDFLSESPLDILRKAGTWARNVSSKAIAAVKKAIAAITQQVSRMLQKIVKMGKRMFSALLKFLGLEISYTNNVPGEVSL